MFNFKHTKLNQQQIEQLAKLLIQFHQCYATSKFDVAKFKVQLNRPLKATTVFKKQRDTRISLQLEEKVQHLLDILTHFDIIAAVNTDSLTTGNTYKPSNHSQKRRITENCPRNSSIKHND